jgi:hypothetical protein
VDDDDDECIAAAVDDVVVVDDDDDVVVFDDGFGVGMARGCDFGAAGGSGDESLLVSVSSSS